MVTSCTFGVEGQRRNNACNTRAVVDLPTATEPATPIMNGTRRCETPKKSFVIWFSDEAAFTYRFNRRDTGRYTCCTSSRSIVSPKPLKSSISAPVSGTDISAERRDQRVRSSSVKRDQAAEVDAELMTSSVGFLSPAR